MSSVVVDALGVHVEVACEGSVAGELEAAVRHAWRDLVRDEPSTPDLVVRAAVVGEQREAAPGVVAAPTLEAVLELVTQWVTTEAVTSRRHELLMLHACAVADAAGRTAIMVGPSGVGKTTLAAHLGRRWGYVTDETAALTADLRVVPFPKPLSLVSSRHGGKDQVPPGDLGLRAAPADLRPAAVLLLDRHLTDAASAVEPVERLTALALLAEHASFLSSVEEPLHRLAALVEAGGGLRRISYRDVEHVEEAVAEVLEVAPC